MLEFLKAPFLVLHVPCNTSMTFLMLSVDFDTGKNQLVSFEDRYKRGSNGVKRAGMTGVSRGIEYPLPHEILHTV